MRLHFVVFLTLCLPLPGALAAQGTDVYLFDATNGYHLVARVTNRDGYDNQPSFTLDSKAVLFTSDRAGKQYDIFRYDIATAAVADLTNTPNENEFSGQAWGDGFSYVLQEGSPYENVWFRRWDGGPPQRVLTSYIPVGYYARNQKGVLFWARYAYALFFEPAGAHVGPGNGESLFVIGNAGLSPHVIPGTDRFSFVHKQTDWRSVINSFDPDTRAIVPLVQISSQNENYCWTPGGVMLTARGTRMLGFKPGTDKTWQPLVTLEAPGLNEGGRCAVSPDGKYLALVNTRAR